MNFISDKDKPHTKDTQYEDGLIHSLYALDFLPYDFDAVTCTYLTETPKGIFY